MGLILTNTAYICTQICVLVHASNVICNNKLNIDACFHMYIFPSFNEMFLHLYKFTFTFHLYIEVEPRKNNNIRYCKTTPK